MPAISAIFPGRQQATDTRPGWSPTLAMALVVLTASAGGSALAGARWSGRSIGVEILISAGLLTVLWASTTLDRQLQDALEAPAWIRSLAAQLVPMALLTGAYLAAMGRLRHHSIGGVSDPLMILVVSLSVPPLGQTVCQPLYEALTSEREDPREQLAERLFGRMPLVTLESIVPVAALAALVAIVARWSFTAVAVYAGLCLLNGVFAQLLILVVLGKRNDLWSVCWAAYAVGVFLLPRQLFIGPLAGSVVLSVFGARSLGQRPTWIPTEKVPSRFVQGALAGGLLWADKLALVLRSPAAFPAVACFSAMVPALLTYGYYFGRVAPRVDALVAELRHSMQTDKPQDYAAKKAATLGFIVASLRTVVLIGACCAGMGMVIIPRITDLRLATCTGMLAVTWSAAIMTLLVYKLSYLGFKRMAQAASAVQVAVTVAWMCAPLGLTSRYFGLAVTSTVVLFVVGWQALRHWLDPEYSLFWRHAISW